MSLAYAFLLVFILLAFDLMFMKMLANRKRRTAFAIYVENGKIENSEGEIPEKFFLEVRRLCELYRPGKIKIVAKREKAGEQLLISGAVDQEFSEQLQRAYQVYR